MSKQIDERVVSMQFDNRHFESNVQTSISTLDKLKKALHLDGAAKGLQNLDASARKVDMSTLGNSVETVRAKFSALEVMGVTALANITNSAVNAGKQLAKSLSVDQISAGWNKYGQKTSSVQTIMNATGKSIDEVNEYLNRLMWFSDETSYGFTDMTAALAQMTSAGGDIDKLIPLITGVANATAFAGKGASEFSRVMYNLNQSYSKGYLDYTDWKSIDLAGASSKQLKEVIIETAEAMGKVNKGEVTLNNFANTLKDKWADTTVMEKAFGKFAELSEAAYKAVQAGEYETASEAIEALAEKYSEVGVKAFKSAQEAKTFTEAIDATKDAVSSGWMKTFEVIFGNYEQAKKLWTDLANTLWDVFASGGENRNEFLTKLMSYNPLEALVEKINKSGIGKITETAKALSGLTDKVEYYRKVVSKVWRGDYKSAPVRYDLLRKDGYNAKVVQSLVNLGYDKRNKLTEEDIAAAYKKAGISMDEVTEKTISLDEALGKLNDEELKNLGFNADEIKMLRDLQSEAKRLNVPIEQLLKKMEKADGRTLLLDSFKNIGSGLVGVIKALKEAWSDIFPAPSVARVYTLIDAFNRFTEKLRLTDAETGDLNENGNNLKRTFEGVFALIDIVTTLIGGPVKIVLKIIGQLLGAFELNILDVTAGVGDAIVAFRDWLDSVLDFTGIFKKIAPYVEKAIDAVKKWFETFKPFEKIADVFKKASDAISDWFDKVKPIQKVGGWFKAAGDAIKNFSDTVKNSDIVKNILSGLGNGLKDGAKAAWEWMKNLGKRILEAICNVLGIESPSKEFFEIGKNIIAGLINGIKAGFSAIGDTMKELGGKILDVFSGLDLSQLSGWLTNLGRIFPKAKFLGIFAGLSGLFGSFGQDISSGLIGGLGKGAAAVWDAIKKMAIGVADAFCKILGIESPSKVFFAIGGFIIAGLIGGLANGSGDIKAALTNVGQMFIDFFKNLDLGKVAAIGSIIGVFLTIKKILNIADKFGNAAEGFGKLGNSLSGLVDTINKGFDSKFEKSKWTIISEAILKVAIAIGILVASVVVLTKVDPARLWPAVGALAAIMGMVAVLAGIMVAMDILLTKFGKGDGMDQMTKLIGKIVGVLLAMIIVAKIAATMSWGDLARAGAAFVGIGVVIAGLIWATKLAATGGSYATIEMFGKYVSKIAGALLLMIIVAKIAATMSWDDLGKAGAVFVAFGVMIVGLIWATKLANSWKAEDIGKSILQIAGAMLLMGVVAKLAASMSPDEIHRAGIVILAFAAVIVGLMAATRLIAGGKAEEMNAMSKTLLAASGALLIMVMVAKIAASMSPDEIHRGGITILAFAAIIVGLMAATRLIAGGKAEEMNAMSKTLLAAAGAILIMVLVAKIAAAMSPDELHRGGIAVLAFAAIIVGLMAATRLIAGGKAEEMNAMMKTLLGVAAVIGVMALSVALLSLLNPDKMWGATIAMGILVGVFALVLKAASNIQKGMGVLIVLTTAIAVIGTILIILAHLPVDNVIASAASLGGLMLVLTGVLLILGKLENIVKKAFIGVLGLLALCVPLAALVGVLYLMQNVQNAATNAIILAQFAAALTVLLIPLALIGNFGTNAIMGVVGLLALCAPLVALVGILYLMQNVQNATENAKALSVFAAMLSVLLIPLTVVGLLYAATGGLGMLGIVGLLAMCVPLLGLVGILALMQNIKNATENTKLLTTLLTVMTEVLVVLAIVGPLAIVGVAAMAALTTLMLAMGVLAVGIGALMEQFPALKSFLDTGLPVMIQLAGGIGQMIGAFVAGIATELAASLPGIGLSLSQFMINVTPFIMGCKMVDDSVAKGVGILVLAIAAFTVASFIDSVLQFLPIVGSIADLGTQLSLFMLNAQPFIQGAMFLSPAIASSVKALAEAILILTAANMVDGIMRILNLGGPSALETFASQLPLLGRGIHDFVAELGDLTDDQVSMAGRAAEIIKTLAAAAAEIPNTGGLLGSLVGDNDMGPWAEQLPVMASGLANFTNTLVKAELSSESVEIAKKAAEIIKVLAEAASEIPNSGGLLADLVGDNEFGKWASELPNVGEGIAGFTKALIDGGISGDSVGLAKTAAEIVGVLAKVASEIPNSGGWLKQIIGDNKFEEWASQLPNVGKGIANFAGELGTFDEGKLATVKCATEAIKAIAALSQANAGAAISSGGDVGQVGRELVRLAERFKEFVSLFGEISQASIDSAMSKIQDILDMCTTVKSAQANVESCEGVFKSLKKSVAGGIDGILDALTNKITKAQFYVAAGSLLDSFVKGVNDHEDNIRKALSTVVSKAGTGITSKDIIADFKSAGNDLGDGLVDGIEEKWDDAYDAGYELGRQAVLGEKAGQQSNSPSKLTMQAGRWLGEGLIIGINKMDGLVYKSGEGLGKTATDTISSAIARVSEFVSSDIDAQPTIRPVLDLSDVEAGASTIGGMFSGRTLSVNARTAGIVSASMAGRQNGKDTSDIVSAIKALRKDISEMPRDSVNINGITYSGDSEINDAVQTLVRAVKVGGRS